MKAEYVYFLGYVKDAKALQKLIEEYNEDFDENKFSKLMKLSFIDSDFTDYQHFGAPDTVDALIKAVEKSRDRFKAWDFDVLIAALKLASDKVDSVNAMVMCSNNYEPWDLTAFKKCVKGKNWFTLISAHPEEWGKEKPPERPLFVLSPESFYQSWSSKLGLNYSDELRYSMIAAQMLHSFERERFFEVAFSVGKEDEKDSFDSSEFTKWIFSGSSDELLDKYEAPGTLENRLMSELARS